MCSRSVRPSTMTACVSTDMTVERQRLAAISPPHYRMADLIRVKAISAAPRPTARPEWEERGGMRQCMTPTSRVCAHSASFWNRAMSPLMRAEPRPTVISCLAAARLRATMGE